MSSKNFFLIAGPCVIESREHCHYMAKSILNITNKLNINYIFKASFDKANRTSITSFRGTSMKEGLKILTEIRNTYNIPVITDVHDIDQVEEIAEAVDVIQIPAFLCRQTDLLVAVGRAIAGTGKAVHLKKGQFCNYIAMKHAYDKIKNAIETREAELKKEGIYHSSNIHYFWDKQIWLCDRGNMYGYDDLVVDMRGLVQMRKQSGPVNIIQDATHSLQQPNRSGNTLGIRHLIPTIARGAVATGIDGLFMEVHDDPAKAKSDAATQWPLVHLEQLLTELVNIHGVTRGRELQYVEEE
jgi:2-dehydro-3-deoxyphosphooctonate aldolase (KDO 8-P synthase)